MNTFRLHVNVLVLLQRGVFSAELLVERLDIKLYPTLQDLQLISLSAYLAQHPAVASSKGCAPSLHLGG